MKESVIYQDIVQKEAFKLISRHIKRRFGDIDASLFEQVRNLSAEQLEDLGEELLDFSEVADLELWLNENN
jgi:heme oxygenase